MPVDKMPIYKTPVDKTPVDNFVSFDPILTKFRSKQLKIWSRSRIWSKIYNLMNENYIKIKNLAILKLCTCEQVFNGCFWFKQVSWVLLSYL